MNFDLHSGKLIYTPIGYKTDSKYSFSGPNETSFHRVENDFFVQNISAACE